MCTKQPYSANHYHCINNLNIVWHNSEIRSHEIHFSKRLFFMFITVADPGVGEGAGGGEASIGRYWKYYTKSEVHDNLSVKCKVYTGAKLVPYHDYKKL